MYHVALYHSGRAANGLTVVDTLRVVDSMEDVFDYLDAMHAKLARRGVGGRLDIRVMEVWPDRPPRVVHGVREAWEARWR